MLVDFQTRNKTSDINKEQRFSALMTAFSSSVSTSSAMAIYEYDYILKREVFWI